MKKFLFFTLFSICVSTANAQDVIVNQNVLNSLKAVQAAPEPKFPIMPKRVKKAVVIKKHAPKPIIKPKPVVVEPVVEPVVETVAKPAIAEPTTTKTQAPITEAQKPVTIPEFNAKVADIPSAPKTQEKLNVKEQQSLEKQFEKMETVSTKTQPKQTPIPTPVIKAPLKPAPTVEPKALAAPVVKQKPLPALATKPVFQKAEPKNIVPTAVTTPAEVKELKKPQQTIKKPMVHAVVFDSLEANLNPSNKQKIDEIIASFENPTNNKISIVAYNLEDGVDTFKKKRQALNHAIEIRTYLTTKGFNNYSIRVINVKNEPHKANLVEISEMK